MLLAALVVRAQEVPPRDAEFESYARAVIDAAGDSRNARVLLAAASFAGDILLQDKDAALAAQRDALIARAQALGGDDPVVWWVLATDWPSLAPGERARAVRRLRELAPNNALAWLLDGGDDSSLAVDFSRAARSNRADAYDGEWLRALYEAANDVPPPASMLVEFSVSDAEESDLRAHFAIAMGRWIAHALPHLGAYVASCGKDAAPTGARLEECIAIARLMAHRSRNLLMQRLALRVLMKRLPEGDEKQRLSALQRRIDWQTERQVEILSQASWPQGIDTWLEASADETSVLRTMLEANGVPFDPPPGWRAREHIVLPDSMFPG